MRKALLWEGPRPILGLLTLNELREAAKAQGLKGYSKFSFRRFGGRSRAARRVKFPPANRS